MEVTQVETVESVNEASIELVKVVESSGLEAQTALYLKEKFPADAKGLLTKVSNFIREKSAAI